jgi:Na+-transporting NADH:ubiquinone oxidoreductase subunit NqrD
MRVTDGDKAVLALSIIGVIGSLAVVTKVPTAPVSCVAEPSSGIC